MSSCNLRSSSFNLPNLALVVIVADVNRVVTNFVNDGALITIGVLALGAVIASRFLQSRFSGSRGAACAALLSLCPIIAVTMLRREGFGLFRLSWSGSGWSWWLHGWGRLAATTVEDTEFVLNVALFVGAGAVWTWCTRQRGWAIALWLLGFSFFIESFQALFGRGAPDVTDLVANTAGTAIGVVCAVVLAGSLGHRLRRPGDVDDGRPRTLRWTRRRWFATVGATVLAVGAGVVGLRLGAAVQQQSLVDELHTAFDRTTKQDLVPYFGENGNLSDFYDRISVYPNDWRWSDGAQTFDARYPVEFFGITNCVFVHWTTDDVSYRTSSGEECTRFNG